MEGIELIQAAAKCLETSNMLLNSYHQETPPGVKADTIQKMIDTNSSVLVASFEYEGQQVQSEENESDYLGQFFAIPMEKHTEIIFLLNQCEEFQPDEYVSDRLDIIFNNIEKVVELLAIKDDE